jgi:hypothetical protein
MPVKKPVKKPVQKRAEKAEGEMWRPVVTEQRWHWIVSGLVSFAVIFLVAWVFWLIFVDYRVLLRSAYIFVPSAVAGWGILALVGQIWFDHYPYNKIKNFLFHSIVGTIVNGVLVAVVFLFFWYIVGPYMIPMFSPFTLIFAGYSAQRAWFLSSSAIGTMLACGFSFAMIWAAGAMYWPFTGDKTLKRGFEVFLVSVIITAATWLFLFWNFQRADVMPPATTTIEWTVWTAVPFWATTNAGAYTSLAFTQWTITFGLLTLMLWEYFPWKQLKKQPWIGVAALLGSAILGGIVSLFIIPLIWPGVLGYAASTSLAVFTTTMIFIWSQYFDNWPHGFIMPLNLLIRAVIVFLFGFLAWFAQIFVGGLLFGEVFFGTTWVLWLLWFMLLHVYIWKRVPGWKTV